VLGDVSGKGVSAALYMTQIMTVCRILLPGATGPSAFLQQANKVLIDAFEAGVFATIAVVFLNTDKGVARISLAGQSAPTLRTKDGKLVEFTFDTGLPLCASATLAPPEHRLQLEAGDALILHSDGVEEAEPTEKKAPFVSRVFFGLDSRNKALRGRVGAEMLAIGLREAVFSYRGEARSSDDLAIMVIERNG
jgi:phosphoserine phosphatase RsbU/P